MPSSISLKVLVDVAIETAKPPAMMGSFLRGHFLFFGLGVNVGAVPSSLRTSLQTSPTLELEAILHSDYLIKQQKDQPATTVELHQWAHRSEQRAMMHFEWARDGLCQITGGRRKCRWRHRLR